MNTILEQINSAGYAFVEFAVPMLVQSSVLIVILLLADLLLRKKVRAVFRYCIWMLVLVKLVLPSSLSSPVSFGYWFGAELPSIKVTDKSAAVSPVNMSRMAEPVSIEVSSEAPAPMMDVEPAVAEAAGRPVVTSAAPVTWQGVVFLVWLAVVAAMGLLLLQRAIFVIGLVAQAKGASGLMGDVLEYCRKRVGVKGKVGLKVSANATSPAVCGLFRPVILVPENLGPSLGAGGLRVVLLHELAHIKRGDLWINLVQTVLQIIYFYNPLLWLGNAMICRVREQAVDEAVQVAMGEKAKQYPETLVNVAKLAFKRPALSLRLIGVVESKSALKGRIKHMLGRPIPKSAKLGIFSLVVVLIVGAVLLPMAKAERFTDRAEEVMALADQEARRLNHEYIGTEHILLGLVREGSGVGATALKNLDVDIKKVRLGVDRLVKSGPDKVKKRKLPQTPRAKRVMEYAIEEAKTLNHNYVGTEHILLGLLRVREGIGAQVLVNLGLKLEDIRQEVLNLLQPGLKTDTSEERHFVRLVVGRNRVTFEGQEVTLDELPGLMEKVPNRHSTVFEIAITTKKIPFERYDDVKNQADKLVEQFGFEYLSYVGVHPLRSKGGPSETEKTSPVAKARGIDLLQRYPTTLTEKSTDPGKAREWKFSPEDIYSLSRFSFEVGDALGIKMGAANVGIGHCADGAVWAVVIPKEYGSLRSSAHSGPEKIKHLWLRFHPAEVTNLFGKETVIGSGDKSLQTLMQKVADIKMHSSWQAGGRAMIPGRKDFTVDVDIEKGIRRFFVVDREANSVRYISAFENRIVPAGEIDKKRPVVVKTQPEAFANDVSPGLKTIKVMFDKAMLNRSWSWVGSGETYPETTGEPYYDSSKKTCNLPVKLEAGKVYWIGINSPQHKFFQTARHIPTVPYVILFATKDKDGNPTTIPEYMLTKAKGINSTARIEKEEIKTKPEPAGSANQAKKDVEVEKSEVNRFYELLNEAVTVDIEHSPRNERLSVQYAVIAICEAAGVPYQWEKSSKLSGAKCRQYIEPVHIKNVLAEKAIRDVVFAVGLTFEVDDHGLYLTPNSDTNHLQSLIDSARRGSTVIVPKGVYTKPIEINKSLTLKGESRADCVFEVTDDKPAIFVDTRGKGQVLIEGLTIKWQLATSDNVRSPFALYVKDSKAEVKNCSFEPLGNFKRSVVAVRADGFSNLTISRCRFEGFEYVVGYGEGIEGTVSDNLIMDCGHQGITLYEGAKAQIIRNVITGSRYHAVRSTGGTLYMKDNLIINNANRGVYLGNKSARGTISNNIIMGNGTGISGFAQSKVKIENNIILNSSYAGIGMRDSCSFLIRDNIFQGNERGWILFKEGGKGGNTVYRNTFWKNRIDAENFRKTANSVEAEPGFVDADNGDFSLRRGLAKGHKQGLTNPQVFKTLWKRWQNRADKNILFSRAGEIDVEVEAEETGEVNDADKMASENFAGEAWGLWRQRKLAEAEKVFKKAVLKDPKNANAWNGLGWSQFNQGKSLNAKVSFEKCLKIQPKHAAALNGLGWIAKGQGKTDEAIGHWEKAVEAAPGATAALNGLATTYMELEQYDKAGKYYEMWLNVEPDNADAKAGLEKAKAVLKRK